MKQIRQTISRNNRIIIITSLFIILSIFLTMATNKEVELYTIHVGDDVFSVANILQGHANDVQITPISFIIDYYPPTPWASLNSHYQQSQYEITYINNIIRSINWRHRSGTLISSDMPQVTVALP